MLTDKNFLNGTNAHEQTKYNINYCKKPLFDIVCANLAQKMLVQEFITLTDETREKLENLINK